MPQMKSPSKRTVLHVTSTLEDHGYVDLIWQFAQQIDPGKYKVLVCGMRKGGPYIQKFRDLGVEVLDLNMKNYLDLRAVPRLVRFIKDNKVDIVHTHVRLADWYGRICARLAKVPVVLSTIHSTDYWRRDRKYFLYALFDKLTLLLNTHVIAVSQAVKEFLVRWQKIDPKRITVVLNGVPISKYRGKKKDLKLLNSLGLKSDLTTIGITARLVKQKAAHCLLDAIAIMSSERNDFQVLIVGEGPLRRKLESQSRRLDIEDRVVFSGFRTDVPDLLASMDIFVMPSIIEGLCLSIMEAMCAGLPVVATKIGGIKELVIQNETGILVPPLCPKALAEGLSQLLNSPALRKRLGHSGYARALEEFSIERMSREQELLYDSLE